MPDRDVKTILDLIYYQYSKIVARRAFGAADGKEAKSKHYGFIKKTFRELKSGIKSWSEITREDWQLIEAEKRCAYCGSESDLHREHIVPKSLRLKPECETCETIQGIHNQTCPLGLARGRPESVDSARRSVDSARYRRIRDEIRDEPGRRIWACNRCNSSKWTKEFYGGETPSETRFLDRARNDKGERKFYDLIPPLLEKKYLKTIINCHKCAETLNNGDLDNDREITVLDIDFILHQT